MRIYYKKYNSSGLATFLSFIGAFALYLGLAWFVMVIAMTSKGVEDSSTGIFLLISFALIIVGALFRFKLADSIANAAYKKKIKSMEDSQNAE